MVTPDRRKSSRYLWRTSVIATMAVCCGFMYFSLFSGKDQVSSIPNPKSVVSSAEMLITEGCISVCDSKECVYLSKYLHDIMDTDANPCGNFFQLACGKVSEKYELEKFSSYPERYADILSAKLKIILDHINADPGSASGKMKTVYDSCMKYSSSDFRAVSTVLDFLGGVGLRGWPNLPPDFKFEEPCLERVLANFSTFKEFAFVEFSTKSEFMYFAPPGLKLNLTVLDEKSSYEKHDEPTRKYLVDRILKHFNLDPGLIGKIWEESEAIHDAIINLREESLGKQGDYEALDNVLDCTQNTRNKWEEICEYLEFLINITGANEKVSKNFSYIRDSSVHFMLNIFPALRKFDDRSIANYLAINVLLNNLKEINFYFRLLKNKVTLNRDETDSSSLKWINCVTWISKNMALAIGHEYLKADFTLPLIQDVQNLTNECFRVTADLVSRQEWINEEERRNLTWKILMELELNFDSIIEFLPNETRINLFFEQFHPTDENFFRSVLEYKRCFRIQEIHNSISYEDTELADTLLLVNAFNGGLSIVISLGLLMPPTYTQRLERFMNLIAVGNVIAHETGHYLEFEFSMYKSKDEMAQESDYYENKLKCLVDQYSEFWIETIEKNVNGSSQFSENFADNVAVLIIDKLVEKYASDISSSLLPSFPFSLKQQMYINTAQMFCEVHTKDSDLHFYKDAHTADRFRLLGMMQNSKGFSEAFGCPEGSYMNPANKCLVL